MTTQKMMIEVETQSIGNFLETMRNTDFSLFAKSPERSLTENFQAAARRTFEMFESKVNSAYGLSDTELMWWRKSYRIAITVAAGRAFDEDRKVSADEVAKIAMLNAFHRFTQDESTTIGKFYTLTF